MKLDRYIKNRASQIVKEPGTQQQFLAVMKVVDRWRKKNRDR